MRGRRHLPSLGFDPAPGDQATADEVARTVRDTARALEEVAAVLTGAADGAWRGQAAIAFRDLLSDELRPKVVTASQAFSAAARALEAWRSTMRASQSRADRLEARHAAASRRARAARAALASLPAGAPLSPLATPGEVQAAQHLASARAQTARMVADAEAEVQTVHSEAVSLQAEYEELGRTTARQLQHALDVAPQEPGFWSGLADSVGGVLATVGEAVADVRDGLVEQLERLSPLLDQIGEVLGAISTVMALLAFVPGLQFLAVPALVFGAVGALAHYGAAVGETGSFGEALTDGQFLMAGLGVVLGAGAFAAASRVTAAAKAGSTATSAGAPAVRKVPQLLGGEKVLPYSYYGLARSASYSMGAAEAGWRAVSYHATASTLVHTVAGGRDTLATLDRVRRLSFGPTTRPTSVVR